MLRKTIILLLMVLFVNTNNSLGQSNQNIINATDFGEKPYKIGNVLYENDFTNSEHWIVEQQPGGSAKFINNSLDVNDKKGTTVWLNKEFSSPVLIEYEVMVNGDSKVTDMNCFWMAKEPSSKSIQKRYGQFKEYNKLKLYYVGVGGHSNFKTRFRKYDGKGNKPLKPEHDLSDKKYLLEADTTYKIQLVAFKNRIQYFRNGICFYDVLDKNPSLSGRFGFRIYTSHQTFKNLKVYNLLAK